MPEAARKVAQVVRRHKISIGKDRNPNRKDWEILIQWRKNVMSGHYAREGENLGASLAKFMHLGETPIDIADAIIGNLKALHPKS